MLYVQQSLAPDEELICMGRFHWFYDVHAIMNIVWGLFFAISILVSVVAAVEYLPAALSKYLLSFPPEAGDGWITLVRKIHPGFKLFSLLLFLMGVLKFAQMMVIKATTEIAVTSNRLIFKRGLVARYVGEMNIDRIESISVVQSVFGRIFDFGQLVIRGMGVGELILPPIADPVGFRRALERARTG